MPQSMSHSTPVAVEKRAFRARAIERRGALRTDCPEAGVRVRDHLLAARARLGLPDRGIAGHPVVAAYWPMGDELDIRPAIDALIVAGFGCALPAVVAKGVPLAFRAYRPGQALVNSSFGVAEPAADAPLVVPVLVLVPLLAFDDAGYRLGYGAGFYDFTLAVLHGACAVGVGFAGQKIARVPRERRDRPMDWLLTQDGLRAADRAEHPP